MAFGPHGSAIRARRRMLAAAALALLPTSRARSAAAAWPQDRPIRIVVPYPPGGASDFVTRLIAQHLGQRLDRPVIVDNVPGASGNIGAQRVVRAAPDGHTLLAALVPLTTNPAVTKDMPFDVVRDLAPITLVTLQPYVLVLHPSVPASTLPELVALARREPGRLSYASHSAGGATHLAGEWFKLLAGVDLLHVPYKGGGPALVDLLGGQVSMMFDNVSTALLHGPQGRVKPIATTGRDPTPLLLNGTLPTVSSFKGFESFDILTWVGYMAPAGTPAPAVERLSAEINAVAKIPEVSRRLNELGFQVAGTTPQAFGERIRTELDTWARIVREAGIKTD